MHLYVWNMCIYVHTCIDMIHTHLCMHVICVCVYIYTCLLTYTYMHKWCTHICIYMQTFVYMPINIPKFIHSYIIHTSESHDNDTEANGITWPNCHAAPHFDHLDVSNAMVPLTISFTSHDVDAGANCVTSPKKSYYMSFQSSWAKECIGVIDDTIGITWNQCLVPIVSHGQKCHVAPNFNHLELWMQWYYWCCCQVHDAKASANSTTWP